MGLLNAYGKYTCFAPTNEAMFEFYKKKGISSLYDIPVDSVKKIVYDHIINGSEVVSADFVEGRLTQLTMSDRYISIDYSTNNNKVIINVNKTSPILEGDIEVHNGVIHSIGEVLNPTEKTIVEALAGETNFSLFFKALLQTGLDQKLTLIEDETYDPNSITVQDEFTGIGSKIMIPTARKYGFTAFIESDSTYATYGINSVEDLKNYAKEVYDQVYPEDAGIEDVTNPKNSLNRFIAYHLLDKQLSYTRLISDYDNTGHSIRIYDMFEYTATMCENTLMEIRTNRFTNESTLINMIQATGEAVRISPTNYDNDAKNGVYHEIDKILTYSRDVISEISSKRIRMDVASFFPEFANNNIRGKVVAAWPSERWIFPQGYIEGVTTAETTSFGYYSSDDRFLDYQGDEIFLSGLYDFEITTPPIPAGTYEIRMGYKVEPVRGAAQLYWDGLPIGIPLDLSIPASDPKIGYQLPGSNPNDPEGYENDKMMHNRGYMKGPASFQPVSTVWFNGTARNNAGYIRKVFGTYTFETTEKHKFSVRAARSGEFMLDFLEFVPLEVLEYEGVD